MHILNLPYEILLNIAHYLIAEDIVNLSRINIKFLKICYDYSFWIRLAKDNLSFPIEKFIVREVSPAQRYFDISTTKYMLDDAWDQSIRNGDLYQFDIAINYINPTDFDIEYASLRNNVAIIERLINIGVNPSSNENQPIRWAALGNPDVVNRLLEDNRVDPSDKNNYAIIAASKCGHLDIVNRLLADSRVNPTDQNNLAIRFAMEYNHLHVVDRLLIDQRIDPSKFDTSIVMGVVKNSHVDIINKLLLDGRIDPTIILKCAVDEGNTYILEYINKHIR